jgi:transposase
VKGVSLVGRPSKYSAEFRRDAVALVRDSQVPVKTAARDLGMHPETLRVWVKQDRIDRGEGAAGELTSTEKAELAELRRRVVVLEQEREILKKATAFFVKETTR